MEDHAGTPREQLIAEAAYYRAVKRGFVPGFALEDWLFAEKLIDFEMLGVRPKDNPSSRS